MRLIPWFSLISGLLLFVALTAVSMHASKRDVPEDGFKAAQSITAAALGIERDVACVWGDDGVRSEADLKLGQDDGRVHDHWMCDNENVVLRSPHGSSFGTKGRALAHAIGPGSEFLAAFVLFMAGGLGLFLTRDRY